MLSRRSIEDTKKLFISTDTKPIQIGDIFDGGFRDDHYHKTFTEQAQKAEQELFFAQGEHESKVHESKKAKSDRGKRSEQKSASKDSEVVQADLDKILVATCWVWDDKQYSENITKLEYLVQANADINTRQGIGYFRETLLSRMLYEDEKKHKLQRALINLADLFSLEPKEPNTKRAVVTTPFSIVTSKYEFDLMELMLQRDCEPNRIALNGMTPLISICRFNPRKSKAEQNKRFRCLELLVQFEGPDARRLKRNWAKIWDEIWPDGGEEVWLIVASFCIPNINVHPTFKDKNAVEWLSEYDNPMLFYEEGLKLISEAATTQKEKYWPKNRVEYIRLFKPHWAKDN